MIRINLLPGPQRKRKGTGGIRFANFSEMFAKVRNPLAISVVGAWIAAILVVAGLWGLQARQMASLRNDQERIETEARRFRTLIQQKRKAERLRDSLVAELTAIREIDSDRYVWPHILAEVTKALPDYTWLVSIETIASPLEEGADSTAKPATRFQIDGRTSDLSAYTRFVSALANSPWIQNAEFGPVQSVLEEDRPVNAFTVTVTYKVADSAYIRTVPVERSVVR
jgi:Tfp pilus assembly protein PilN